MHASTIFQTNFGGIDWVIVVVYLAGTLAVGIGVNRWMGSLKDFIVAGRGLRLYLAIATMTGTEIGLVTIMYNAQEGFAKGISAYVIGICWFLGLLAVGLTGFIVRPLRAREIMTIPEFYEQRFGIRTRIIGGIILALAGIVNMGLFLQADARFLTSVFGMGPGAGFKIIMTVMLIFVLVYTVLGGMVSVVITDYMQFVMLGSAMVIATVVAVRTVGWTNIVHVVAAQRGVAGINPVAHGSYGWQYIIWMIYMGVAAGSLWATATARALSVRTPKVAQQLYVWSSITFLSRVILPVTWGVAALAYVASRPDLSSLLLGASPKLSTQYAMPLFMAHLIPTGWIGLMTAGMMAASMSTYSSYFLQWAAIITQDIVAPLHHVRPATRNLASGIFGVFGGGILAAVVYGIIKLACGAASGGAVRSLLPGQQPLAGAVSQIVSTQLAVAIAIVVGCVFAGWSAVRIARGLSTTELSEKARILLTRVTVVLIGLYLLFWGLWYEAPSTLWTYMAITGTVYLSGAFVCIVFGLYWKRATEAGAIAALLCGLVSMLGLLPWKEWGVPWLTDTNIATFTIVLAAVAMFVVSVIFRGARPKSAPASSGEVS